MMVDGHSTSTLSTTTHINTLAALQRRLALLRDTAASHPPPWSRQLDEQVQRIALTVQQALEQLVRDQRELDAVAAEITAIRQRQLELLEALGPCVVTGTDGVIVQANTPALLMLRASACRLGQQRIQELAPDAGSLVASLEAGTSTLTAPLGIPAGRLSHPVDTLVTRVAGDTPQWRWLFRWGRPGAAADTIAGIAGLLD
jgi:hypothetical protein